MTAVVVYGGCGGRWQWWCYIVVVMVGGDVGSHGGGSGDGWCAVVVFCGCSCGWQ